MPEWQSEAESEERTEVYERADKPEGTEVVERPWMFC